jgi:hypothetical protein
MPMNNINWKETMVSGDIELNLGPVLLLEVKVRCYQLKYLYTFWFYTLEFIIKQNFYKHFQMPIKESPPSWASFIHCHFAF